MTLACGTGACASVVIGALEGRCDRMQSFCFPSVNFTSCKNRMMK
jgi:diaminopimelate epimerase